MNPQPRLWWTFGVTLHSGVTPPARRGAVLGAWDGIGGPGAALGPLAGGALAGSVGWRAISWLNGTAVRGLTDPLGRWENDPRGAVPAGAAARAADARHGRGTRP